MIANISNHHPNMPTVADDKLASLLQVISSQVFGGVTSRQTSLALQPHPIKLEPVQLSAASLRALSPILTQTLLAGAPTTRADILYSPNSHASNVHGHLCNNISI